MGTTKAAMTRYRRGKQWPHKCVGPGKLQHRKGCHPSRPRCKWRRKCQKRFKKCECGIPYYPHRIKSVDWKNGGACLHHPDSDRINFEMVSLRDFETGDALDPTDICSERYAEYAF